MDFEKDLHNYDYGVDVFGYKSKEVPSKTSDEIIEKK